MYPFRALIKKRSEAMSIGATQMLARIRAISSLNVGNRPVANSVILDVSVLEMIGNK